jgi:hypothetical protein
LGANVENLVLTGSSNINGTGNSGNNTLTGNTGNNTLNGGLGDDTYVFGTGDGQDVVRDTGGTNDKILFGAGLGTADVAFFMNGTTLEIGYVGNVADKISVQNQSVAINQIDRFELNNGNYLTAADVNQVIQDINTYAAGNSITINSIEDIKGNASLMAIITAAWN